MAWWKLWEKTPPGDATASKAGATVPTYRDAETAEASGDVDEHYERALELWLAGYQTEAQIRQQILEDIEHDDERLIEEPVRSALATRLVDRAKVEALRRADEFPATTDNDKLEAAFAELERRGIVARENFTCCSSCGGSEIAEQIHEAGEAGLSVRGYVFFHEQDTTAAIGGSGVMLAFGAVEEADVATRAIGHEACDVLRAQGLAPIWAGDVKRRIVVPLTWQRRPGRGYPEQTLLPR